MTKMQILDLFSGAGGLSEGFLSLKDFDIRAFVDWNKDALETLKYNLSNKWAVSDIDKRVIHFDIQKTTQLINGWTEDSGYPSRHFLQ